MEVRSWFRRARAIDVTPKTVAPNLYPLYSPPGHPDATVHKIRAEAEAA
jgi:hypothetical protein